MTSGSTSAPRMMDRRPGYSEEIEKSLVLEDQTIYCYIIRSYIYIYIIIFLLVRVLVHYTSTSTLH